LVIIYYTFNSESEGERIGKIGKHVAKLRCPVNSRVFTYFILHVATFCCSDGNTHNPGDSPIIGHVTRPDLNLEPQGVGE